MPTPDNKSELPVWEEARRDSDLTLELPGGVPMFFRKIPAGKFRMGSRGGRLNEEPVHEVVIAKEFYLGTFVVTQEQWRAVAKKCPALKKRTEPSNLKGDRRPVENVSWDDANAFCEWLVKWCSASGKSLK
jgi:formylglycine-generating enzyme required for sulfatase activity